MVISALPRIALFVSCALFASLINGQSNVDLKVRNHQRGCPPEAWGCPDTGSVVYSITLETGFASDSVWIYQGPDLKYVFLATTKESNRYAGTWSITGTAENEAIRIKLNERTYHMRLDREHCYVYLNKKGHRLRAKATKCLWKIYM